MKIISQEESRKILNNQYRKEALEKHAETLKKADPEERARILARIESEVRKRVASQMITGH